MLVRNITGKPIFTMITFHHLLAEKGAPYLPPLLATTMKDPSKVFNNTCSGYAWGHVAKTDGGHGHKAEVESIKETPVLI